MPKPAKEYSVLETDDPAKAMRFVAFPVIRVPLFCLIDGKQIELPKEAIFRKDPLAYFETLSADYAVIKHASAFKAMIDALGPFEWALRWVSLDQAGARMSACFQFKRSYEIDPNDSLKAQITLVNSYNTATALGLHLGFFREIHGSTMLDTNDFRSRWVHAGNEAESAAFGKAIEAALRDFEQRGLPHYRKMAAHTLDQSQALRAVILAIKKDILPQKLAEAALRCVFTDTNHSAWSVFNALARALTSFQGTPTRLMEIQQKIARNFKDGGVHLLGGIGDISQQELDSWNRGAA